MTAAWEHDDIFPVIARIVQQRGSAANAFVTHDDIKRALLSDAQGAAQVEQARLESNGEWSSEYIASNMVAWFSQKFTMGNSAWLNDFDRIQVDGNWAYKPKVPNLIVEPVVLAERDYRLEVWNALKAQGGPDRVSPGLLRELGIYGGAQGIWVDKERTSQVTTTGEGVTVAVLHTGSSYADDLSDDGIIYHYPQTGRPAGRDLTEINATKAACRLGIPFFVITYRSSARSRRNPCAKMAATH
jgi:hypothetical protein